MKTKQSKVTRRITMALSAIMLSEQLAGTGAVLYSHAEDEIKTEYKIEHSVNSSWDGGCNANIILTNLADRDTQDWSITFCTEDKIESIWGGTITECLEINKAEELEEAEEIKEDEEAEDAEEAFEDIFEEAFEDEINDETDDEFENELEDVPEEDFNNEESLEDEVQDTTDDLEDVEETTEDETEIDEEELSVESQEYSYDAPAVDDAEVYYQYTVEALDYNAVIAAGESVTIGYSAAGSNHDIWDEKAEITYATGAIVEQSPSNEKGVSNDQIVDTTYVFENENYAVNYIVQSHWEGHCNVKIEIENRSETKIDNWNLTFFTEDKINNPYNAVLVADGSEEGKITLKNAGYNQDIPVGGSVSFGFEVVYGERFDRPEAFYLGDGESIVSEDLYIFTNTITGEWDGGCTGALTIQNLGKNAIEDWCLVLRVEGSIISTWGGNLKEIGDGIYEIECPDHSQNIPAGGSVTIGYQGGQKPEITLLELREKNSMSNGLGNTVSGNGAHFINKNGEEQHIFIDTEAFEIEATSIYSVYENVVEISGFTKYDSEFVTAEMHIEDLYGEIVWKGEITSKDGYKTWNVDNFGLILGANILVFTLTDTDGNENEEELFVINYEKANMGRTLINLIDTDNDGIYDYYEKYYGTDPNNADTDGDSLNDGLEVYELYLDPTKSDSDDDGISDPNEDNDNDELSVVREYEIGTTDWADDSDEDGLRDGYEVNTIGTDPLKKDTDEDGFTDKEELDLGMNPLSKDSDGDGVLDSDEIIIQTNSYTPRNENNAISEVSVRIGCKGSALDKVIIYENSNSIIANTPGIIGKPVNIETDIPFDTAQICFSYDEDMLGDSLEDDLCIMWYNDIDNEYVLLEDSVCDTENNKVTYTTTHFSTYFLIDSYKWKGGFTTKEYTNKRIDYLNTTVTENYDFIVFLDYTLAESYRKIEERLASSIVAEMEPGDRMIIFYVTSDNLLTIVDQNGDFIWHTTKEDALKYINPYTSGILDESTTTDLFMSDSYDGRMDLAIEAINDMPNSGNKKMSYIFYPGKKYDSLLEQKAQMIETNIQVASLEGSEINTIAIAYSASELLDEYIEMLGGEQYFNCADGKITGEIVTMDAISDHLSKRLTATSGHKLDSDGDGLFDVWENQGMRAANGLVFHTDPNNADTDGDGYSDSQEIGEYIYSTGNFQLFSDPTDDNSIPYPLGLKYIIAWSYSGDKDILPFEATYNMLQSCGNIPYDPPLIEDGLTNEWTDEIMQLFEQKCNYCLAAETKKRELIAQGVKEEQIVFCRIDGAFLLMNK